MLVDQTELASLLAAIAREDRAAFGRLYELTAPKLLGVVLRIVRDRAQAEDVVQDAYIKVWHGAASFSPEAGQPMAWLTAIARYRAIDLVRRRTETILPGGGDDERDRWEQVPDPVDGEAALIESDRLERCLGRLDPVQRRCFVEAYRDGYSREELAARFSRPVNTIKTWLHRSAHALRSCLEET